MPRGIRALRELRAALHRTPPDESTLLEARMCDAMKNGPSNAQLRMVDQSLLRHALRVGLGVGDLARAMAKKLAGRPTVSSSHIELIGFFEQAPNPASRVTLSSDVDALGKPKARVDWQLTALDRLTYVTSATLFGNELAAACGGVFRIEPWLSEGGQTIPKVHGTGHHLGTTRMSHSAEDGVVNPHGRVHGIDNLHIAGSSVFPTGGWAFPTFTIVALSLRLAENLHHLLTASTTSVGLDQTAG